MTSDIICSQTDPSWPNLIMSNAVSLPLYLHDLVCHNETQPDLTSSTTTLNIPSCVSNMQVIYPSNDQMCDRGGHLFRSGVTQYYPSWPLRDIPGLDIAIPWSWITWCDISGMAVTWRNTFQRNLPVTYWMHAWLRVDLQELIRSNLS